MPLWCGSSEKVRDDMKGLKLCVAGVCVSLLAIALALSNFMAIVGATIGLLLAIVGYFIKDN